MAEGTFVAPGETIPLSLVYDETLVEPESLEIRLFDAAGREVSLDEISGSELSDPPAALALPVLPEGRYLIEFSLYGAEGLIATERIVFFYTDAIYILRSVTSFPAVAVPGGSVLFIADMDIPDGKDPYLRWRADEEIFHAGYSSDGAHSVQFSVPEDEGVYAVRLELFPDAPPAGETYGFDSRLFLETQVFVSSSQKEGRYDLSPVESYSSLFHFRGETIDYAEGGRDRPSVVIGEPLLAADGSLFGYRFDGTSGVLLDRPILPPRIDGPGVGPFSLGVRGALELPADEEAYLLRVFDASRESPFFSLSSGADGIMRAFIGGRIGTFDAGDVLDGKEHMFTLSFIPGIASFQLVWYVDGIEAQRDDFPGVIRSYPDGGTSIIAGAGGPVGLIDELGIYSADFDGTPGPDPDVFADAMRVGFGDRLLFADGFDGIRLPPGSSIVGNPTVHDGILSIPPGGAVRFPDPLRIAGSVEAEVTADGTSSGGSASLVDAASGTVYFEYRFDGTVLSGGAGVLSSDGSGAFGIRREGSVLHLSVPGDPNLFSFELSDGVAPYLLIANDADAPSNLDIDSVLVYRLSRSVAVAENDEG